ncbi:hypothetical protein GCM10025868_03760 [Angustibacter aerolatus]|uniref:Prepilin type IV endopeptidase peptidase domain-containing protein n=1 Tax=Angustibacter aerolatus TaxID=1162965 RepID=A0ABQ6JBZ3_9ACTN|nr:hypothetical protein GCM10025868_03760 [Angustibacter aerolatus]
MRGRSGMGGGDIRLAPLLGAYLGYLGFDVLVVGWFLGFLFGALQGVPTMLVRRSGWATRIPFGPFMFLGAWVSVWAGHAIGDLYLRLTLGG